MIDIERHGIKIMETGKKPANPNANKYLEAKIRTASREQLLMMLIDGAIRFTEQGKQKLAESRYEEMNASFSRAQAIMLELISSLNESTMDKEVYTNIIGLYKFIYLRLVNVNTKHEVSQADEALEVLGNVREIWLTAIEKMYEDGASKMDMIPKGSESGLGFVAEG